MKLMVSGATTTVESLLDNAAVVPYLGAMVTPNTCNSIERICRWRLPYCADAGCFPIERFNEGAYTSMISRLAKAWNRPVFVVVPDVVRMTPDGPVGDHQETLERFYDWLPRLREYHLPLAFVAQDGLDMDDIPWAAIAAVFIGGSDDFKDEMTLHIAEDCREAGKWCHLGRVNGRARLRLALHNGVDSVDGTSLSQFADTYIAKFAGFCRELEAEAVESDEAFAMTRAQLRVLSFFSS